MEVKITPLLGGNPGFAGETGDFGHLSEADVRGADFIGRRPVEGGHPGGACSYPYQLAERQPEAPLFAGPYAERLEKIRSRYPDAQGALLPALNLAQEIRGWLSQDSMNQVAEALGLSATYVRGVATFYTMYNKQPVGTFLVQVCTNVACNLCGADEVMEAFLEGTGTEPGELSADGVFTVIEAECLGACGFPTVVQVNERSFENIGVGEVGGVLERLRGEAAALGVARSAEARSAEALHGGVIAAAGGNAAGEHAADGAGARGEPAAGRNEAAPRPDAEPGQGGD